MSATISRGAYGLHSGRWAAGGKPPRHIIIILRVFVTSWLRPLTGCTEEREHARCNAALSRSPQRLEGPGQYEEDHEGRDQPESRRRPRDQ
jgi:hypothetical protein